MFQILKLFFSIFVFIDKLGTYTMANRTDANRGIANRGIANRGKNNPKLALPAHIQIPSRSKLSTPSLLEQYLNKTDGVDLRKIYLDRKKTDPKARNLATPSRSKLPAPSLLEQYLNKTYGVEVDLRKTTEFSELIKHLNKREGRKDHFYRDPNGLVTIGVGVLVNTEALARRLSRNPNLHFFWRHRGNRQRRVTPQDIVSDWHRVNNRRDAKLRISQKSIDYLLLKDRLDGYINELYRQRSYVQFLHPRVHMAIVDVRFNPSGVRLYGPRLKRFWSALQNGQFAIAIQEFTKIWRGRGRKHRVRYASRHAWRVQQLRKGLAASKPPPKVLYPELKVAPSIYK